MRRFALLLTLIACEAPTAPSHDASGVYTLSRVNGQVLPYVLADGHGVTITLLTDTLTLAAPDQLTRTWRLQTVTPSATRQQRTVYPGTYTLEPNGTLYLTFTKDFASTYGELQGRTIYVNLGGYFLVYERQR